MKLSDRRRARVRSDMTAAPEWESTGEVYRGVPVFTETQPKLNRHIQVDGEGKEVWVKHPNTQQPLRPVLVDVVNPKDPTITREFTLFDLGNGTVLKNYHFRDTETRPARALPAEASEVDTLRNEIAVLQDMVFDLKALVGEDDDPEILEAVEELEEDELVAVSADEGE